MLRSFFTEDALISLDVHDLSSKFAVSELVGKALCTSPDLPSTTLDNRAVSKLKQLTGGDNITSDRKFQSRVSFRCTAKFVLATNHALIPRGDDQAFYNRAVVIPFKYATPRDRQDRFLREHLLSELDAIATRAIRDFYPELVRNQYEFPGKYPLNEIIDANAHGNDISTYISNFAVTYFESDSNSLILVDDIFEKFKSVYGVSISKQTFTPIFGACVKELYNAEKIRTHNGYKNSRYHFKGIREKRSESNTITSNQEE